MDCTKCQDILALAKEAPGIRVKAMSESLGLNRRVVLKHLDKLHKDGKIHRANLLSDMRSVAIIPIGAIK